MSSMPHDTDTPGHADAVTDHGDDHGHDDHAHSEEALGPIDLAAWGAGILGVIAGLIVAACFVVATSIPA